MTLLILLQLPMLPLLFLEFCEQLLLPDIIPSSSYRSKAEWLTQLPYEKAC